MIRGNGLSVYYLVSGKGDAGAAGDMGRKRAADSPIFSSGGKIGLNYIHRKQKCLITRQK